MRTADLELAERCRQGDASAFEDLYRQHAGRLYNLAFRMVGSAQEAEDLLQEMFLQAHRKLGSFRGDSTLGTWLYRVGMNHCLDYVRGRQAKMARATETLDDEAAVRDSGPPSQRRAAGSRRDPIPGVTAQAVPAVISRIDLERAIGRLPEGCRAAFLLHDVEGFEHHEVAAILGVSIGTSKSQLHRARMKLRAMLAATRTCPSTGAQGTPSKVEG